MTDKVIANVYKFQNGMVMVFDQYGEQMPEYQGEDAIRKIREAGYLGKIELRTWR